MNHEGIVNEIMIGKGYHIFENMIDDSNIQKATRLVRKVTNKYNENTLERRVWNLNQSDDMFSDFIQNLTLYSKNLIRIILTGVFLIRNLCRKTSIQVSYLVVRSLLH